MATVKEDFILERMRKHKLMCFKLLDGTRLIDECDDESVNTEDAINQLQEALSNIDAGTVTVKISNREGSNKAKGGRDYMQFEYQVKVGASSRGTGISGVEGGSTVMKLMNEIGALRAELIKTVYENQIIDLKKSIEDIKADKSNPVLEAVLPMIAGMMGVPGQGNVTRAVAAPSTDAKRSPADKARLQAALNKWITADPENHLEVIEMIAELAAIKPSVYTGTIPILKAQL